MEAKRGGSWESYFESARQAEGEWPADWLTRQHRRVESLAVGTLDLRAAHATALRDMGAEGPPSFTSRADFGSEVAKLLVAVEGWVSIESQFDRFSRPIVTLGDWAGLLFTDNPRRRTSVLAATQVLQGDLDGARATLTGTSAEHESSYLLTEARGDLLFLSLVCLAMLDANGFVDASLSFDAIRPGPALDRAREAIAAAERAGHIDFANQARARLASSPRESHEQMVRRLGVQRISRKAQTYVIWDRQGPGDLFGELPPGVFNVLAVTRGFDETGAANASLIGGGRLTYRLLPQVRKAFAPVLGPGQIVELLLVVESTIGEPSSATAYDVTPPRVPDAIIAVQDPFEDWEDQLFPSAELIDYLIQDRRDRGYGRPFPPSASPPVQARRWRQLRGGALANIEALRRATPILDILDLEHTTQLVVHIDDWTGDLPPTAHDPSSDGWRSLLQARWGTSASRLNSTHHVPGWVLPHLGSRATEPYLRDLRCEGCRASLIAVASAYIAEGAPADATFTPVQLLDLCVEKGACISGLEAWRAQGFVEPWVAAHLASVGLKPVDLMSADDKWPSVKRGGSAEQQWSDRAPRTPAQLRTVPTDLLSAFASVALQSRGRLDECMIELHKQWLSGGRRSFGAEAMLHRGHDADSTRLV